MHEGHIKNLRVLKANLETAIFNKETVVIGGGSFNWAELTSLLQSVVRTIRDHENYKHPNEDSMLKIPRRELHCLVQRYDPTVTEPPLKFITLGSFYMPEIPVDKDNGRALMEAMSSKCRALCFNMRFYSLSDDSKYDYAITVD